MPARPSSPRYWRRSSRSTNAGAATSTSATSPVCTDGGIDIWTHPGLTEPDSINPLYGGRGVYFKDPDSHVLELITAPYA